MTSDVTAVDLDFMLIYNPANVKHIFHVNFQHKNNHIGYFQCISKVCFASLFYKFTKASDQSNRPSLQLVEYISGTLIKEFYRDHFVKNGKFKSNRPAGP